MSRLGSIVVNIVRRGGGPATGVVRGAVTRVIENELCIEVCEGQRHLFRPPTMSANARLLPHSCTTRFTAISGRYFSAAADGEYDLAVIGGGPGGCVFAPNTPPVWGPAFGSPPCSQI
eukprot:1180034-Prorocentrum_minimum.AAC.2